jgi:RimJ/RimL family protein N-acetyltransferase
MSSPPYRIVTDRLVVRCWDPRDAPLLKDALDSSLEHLRPWLAWANDEPQPVEQKAALLRRFRGRFDLGEDFVYGILSRDESEVVGGTGLHARVGDKAFEIGYWIRASRVGEGLATEATGALTRTAFELCDVDRIEIRVEPGNEASRAIPLKLGFVEEATLRRRIHDPEPHDLVIFTLFRDDFASSPAAAAAVEAYDAAGTRVL